LPLESKMLMCINPPQDTDITQPCINTVVAVIALTKWEVHNTWCYVDDYIQYNQQTM